MNLLLIILKVLLVFFLVWLFWDYKGAEFKEFYVSKRRLWRLYGVSDKTFKKWLKRFMPAYAKKWTGRKPISIFEFQLVTIILGDPFQFPTLNKVGMIKKLKEDQKLPKAAYRFLRKRIESVINGLELNGMSKYPPRVAKQLFLVASEELEPEEVYAF